MDKLENTLAENIDLISKSFQKHAPDVWEAAVAYQQSGAVISAFYHVAIIAGFWLIALILLNKIYKPGFAYQASKDVHTWGDSRGNDVYEALVITKWIMIASVLIANIISLSFITDYYVVYVNAEYFAAKDLISAVN